VIADVAGGLSGGGGHLMYRRFDSNLWKTAHLNVPGCEVKIPDSFGGVNLRSAPCAVGLAVSPPTLRRNGPTATEIKPCYVSH